MIVDVLRTRVSNVASMLAALERLEARPRLTVSADNVRRSAALVVPGVGSFGSAVDFMREHLLADAVRDRVQAGRPTLFVCLGLQLLFESSDESRGTAGLGLMPGRVKRFNDDAVKVPQLGWNRVNASDGCTLVDDGYAYFANSYRATDVPDGWSMSYSHHGVPFIASLERGSVLACQFHPELSGEWGARVLSRWLAMARRDAPEEASC